MPVKGGYDKLLNNQEEPSREKPGLMSLLSFHWISETFKTGNCRPLEKSDLLPNDEDNKTKALTEKLLNLWNDEKQMRQRCSKKPRLWLCVCKLFHMKDIFTIIFLSIADVICRILRPLLLGIILSNLMSQNQDKPIMYACAVLLGVTSMGRNISTHLRSWMAEGYGAKLCCALKGIMYTKVSISYIYYVYTKANVSGCVTRPEGCRTEFVLFYTQSMNPVWQIRHEPGSFHSFTRVIQLIRTVYFRPRSFWFVFSKGSVCTDFMPRLS